MPDKLETSISSLEAELEWRLSRSIVDRVARAANEARIAEIDRLVAEARSPKPDRSPSQPGSDMSLALLVVALMFIAFALFLAL